MEAQSPDLGIVEEGDEELASLLGCESCSTSAELAYGPLMILSLT